MVAFKSREADGANLYRRFGPSDRPQWVLYDADECIVSDYCKLSPGQTAPADMTVVRLGVEDSESNTECVCDCSHVTGSPTPVSVSLGSTIYAGSLLLRGSVICEVTAIGANTLMGKLVKQGNFPREKDDEGDTEVLLADRGGDKGL
eukprot:CAMPEP_0118642846 /NCGR_PEP_ID=MMETSP0785-20121206/6054_1 /TAXON_ID=91992 /ORGANISM="Bolidomonas pacifica, Strain CCMP 1866" /LENGTH=146 /DNA_ID=CAMNT_0006534427 /DNA_START=240 /DNA_END=680 /DNA_ORIENTATION=+